MIEKGVLGLSRNFSRIYMLSGGWPQGIVAELLRRSNQKALRALGLVLCKVLSRIETPAPGLELCHG